MQQQAVSVDISILVITNMVRITTIAIVTHIAMMIIQHAAICLALGHIQ